MKGWTLGLAILDLVLTIVGGTVAVMYTLDTQEMERMAIADADRQRERVDVLYRNAYGHV